MGPISDQQRKYDAEIARRRLLRRREACRGSLAEFSKDFWTAAQPGRPVVWGWHLQYVAERIQFYLERGYGTLVIAMPVGMGKSTLVNALAQPWDWLHRPHRHWVNISASDTNAARDSRRSRMVIDSPEYAAIRGPAWTLSRDQNEKVNFACTAGGSRVCKATRAAITGADADVLVVDDPLDAADIELGSPDQVNIRIAECLTRYDEVWVDRLRRIKGMDPNVPAGVRILVMQALHPADLRGVMIKRRDAGQDIEVIVIPEEWDPEVPGGICPADPRTELGQMLLPEFRGKGELEALMLQPGGARKRATRHNQWPSARSGGGVILPEYAAHEYRGDPAYQAKFCQYRFVTADLANKAKEQNDPSAFGVWGWRPPYLLLLHAWAGRIPQPEREKKIRELKAEWECTTAVIEEAASGSATIQNLENVIPGVIGETVGGRDKIERMIPHVTRWESGHVLLPQPEFAPWVGRYRAEIVGMPDVPHDDEWDQTTIAMAHIARMEGLLGDSKGRGVWEDLAAASVDMGWDAPVVGW